MRFLVSCAALVVAMGVLPAFGEDAFKKAIDDISKRTFDLLGPGGSLTKPPLTVPSPMRVQTDREKHDWWHGLYVAESIGSCDKLDELIIYADQYADDWETLCDIENKEVVQGVKGIVLNLTCAAAGGEFKKQETLFELPNSGLLVHPQGTRLMQCPPNEERDARLRELSPSIEARSSGFAVLPERSRFRTVPRPAPRPDRPVTRQCPDGAVFRSDDGTKEFVVLREGTVKAPWDGRDKHLPGRAYKLRLPTGDIGYIWGPMRSYKFITDEETLNAHGVQWSDDGVYVNGFYSIRSDDGQSVLLTISGVECR